VNRWKIPAALEEEVLSRDTRCVYCGVAFSVPALTRGARPSWEHIVNDARMVTLQNIVRCCMSCNASKGTQNLRAWLRSDYCRRKGITESTVAEIVRNALTRL
jgi:5-methylcytosine-specific restriction endonuclease McrA